MISRKEARAHRKFPREGFATSCIFVYLQLDGFCRSQSDGYQSHNDFVSLYGIREVSKWKKGRKTGFASSMPTDGPREASLRTKLLPVLALMVGLLVVAGSALAHHGTANYDMTKMITLKGTVTDFQFINPHTLILFDVKNEKGELEHWQAEATSPNHLVRGGWTRDIVKRGDQITISGYRAKNGTTILRFQKMVLPNGQEIEEGGVDYR